MTMPPPATSAMTSHELIPEAVFAMSATQQEFIAGSSFGGLGPNVRIGNTFRHLFLDGDAKWPPRKTKPIGYTGLPVKATTAEILAALRTYADINVGPDDVHAMLANLLAGKESPLIKESRIDNAFFALDRFGIRQIICVTWTPDELWVVSSVPVASSTRWKKDTRFFYRVGGEPCC